RILLKGYAVKQTGEDPAAETEETPADKEEPAAEAEEGIEVEITEADPETGEDVTDLEVEIVEEETAKEETTEDADA
ncbi:MAG: hypothetical protein IJI27_01215, partial [Oscillospiraceae bacterium]|nr:hypothetical protein [Oscillospiraceae bacterium]